MWWSATDHQGRHRRVGLWPIRTAVRAAGSGDATCRVRLSGIPVVAADYAAAVQRAETVLLAGFDAWRTGDAEGKAIGAATGTLDWVFAEYRFTKLDPKTRRNHEVGFVLVGGHVLKDGRRLGEVRLTVTNTAVADAVYERLLVVTETDTDGNTVTRERRTTTSGDKVLKSWIVQHRRGGASRRRLLGSAEVLSAEQARRSAGSPMAKTRKPTRRPTSTPRAS